MAALKVGDIIDARFELLSVLGEGGFGVVFKARQSSTGQLVAIKLLHADKLLASRDAGLETARFEREMQLIGQLKHPNIVRLIDSGRLPGGELFTVLEYIEGDALSALIDARGGLPPREAARIMGQVLEALSCAHEHGVVHRDLKPQNIMVNTSGARPSAQVLDFGIAAVIETSRPRDYRTLTATGQFHGTPAYMAPEQLREKQLTPQTDIYAWGLVLLECLTGRPAIVADSFAQLIYEQMAPHPVPIPAAVRQHPLGPIIARAIAKPLAERYSSPDEVLRDLEACDLSQELAALPEPSASHPDLPAMLATTVGATDALAVTAEAPLARRAGKDGPDGDPNTAPGAVRAETDRDEAAPARRSGNRALVAAVAVLSTLLVAAVVLIVAGGLTASGKDEPAPQATGSDGDGQAPQTAKKLPPAKALPPQAEEQLAAPDSAATKGFPRAGEPRQAVQGDFAVEPGADASEQALVGQGGAAALIGAAASMVQTEDTPQALPQIELVPEPPPAQVQSEPTARTRSKGAKKIIGRSKPRGEKKQETIHRSKVGVRQEHDRDAAKGE